MPYTDEGKALMLDALRRDAPYMSIHSFKYAAADNELPAGLYHRLSIVLGAPEQGEMQTIDSVRFDIPFGTRTEAAGFWTAPSGGRMVAYAKFPKPIEFKGRGVLEVDLATLDLNGADE